MPEDKPPTDTIDEMELRSALTGPLGDWSLENGALERAVRLPDFRQALELVQKVGEAAERMQHHPDIDIRYNRVRFALISHDAGGITRRDLRLAAAIDELIAGFEGRRAA